LEAFSWVAVQQIGKVWRLVKPPIPGSCKPYGIEPILPSLGRQALKPAAPKAAVKVYKYQIDSGNNWLTLIAPNNTLKQAKERLRFQYGERLKAVVPVE